MLDKFVNAKKSEIENLRKSQAEGSFPPPLAGKRPDFKKALYPARSLPAVIAEYKRASPSRGLICDNLSVEDASRQYAENGAAALSILTEKDFFAGDISFIFRAHEALKGRYARPILRKDFIFDPLQILATAATPASALLLIVRLCPDAEKLGRLRELASGYGLQCVAEVFDERDLEIARASGASIIQVNARDLDSLRVDRAACLSLIQKHPPINDETWIAASGIDNHEQLKAARDYGFAAVLIGSALMKDGKAGQALAALLEG